MAGNRFGVVTAKSVKIDQAWHIERSTNDLTIKDLLNANIIPVTIKTAAPADSLFIGTTGIGIRNSSPRKFLSVGSLTGANAWAGSQGSVVEIVGSDAPINGGGLLRLVTNNAQAVNLGGSLVFGGNYSTGNSVDFAEIAGRKENGTDNNSSGYLAFGTRLTGGNILERMRISGAGDVLIGAQTVATNTLRYFDIYNADTGANAGSIIRLITNNVANTALITVDIVKYRSGGFSIVNNETNAAAFISLNVGASERMRIDSSGRVGIGLSPAHMLDVNGSGRFVASAPTTGAVILRANVSNQPAYIQWVNNANTIERGWIVVNESSHMQFATVSTERMRLTSAGTLCIGTTTSVGTERLNVVGPVSGVSARFSDNVTSAFYISHSGGIVTLGTDPGQVFSIKGWTFTDGGQLSSPFGDKLQVQGGPAGSTAPIVRFHFSSADYGLIRFGNNTTYDGIFHFIRENAAVYATIYAGAFTVISDRSLKDNVQVCGGLDLIKRLRGVEYDMKPDKIHSFGLIAQEVELVIPDIVKIMEGGRKGIEYTALIAPLINAVKELSDRLDNVGA
jgi:hypothetical protein